MGSAAASIGTACTQLRRGSARPIGSLVVRRLACVRDDDVGPPHAQLAHEVLFDLLEGAAVVFAVERCQQVGGRERQVGGGKWKSPGGVGGGGAGEEHRLSRVRCSRSPDAASSSSSAACEENVDGGDVAVGGAGVGEELRAGHRSRRRRWRAARRAGRRCVAVARFGRRRVSPGCCRGRRRPNRGRRRRTSSARSGADWPVANDCQVWPLSGEWKMRVPGEPAIQTC